MDIETSPAATHYDMTDVHGRKAYAAALVTEAGSTHARVWVGAHAGEVRIYTGNRGDYLTLDGAGDLDYEFCGGSVNQSAKFSKWDAADDALMESSTFTTA